MNQSVTVQAIQNTIFTLPGRQPFMLGQDLAAVYETETKYITRAVERNPDRFPDDFVFQLTDEETAALKSQIASSNPELKCQFGTSKLSPMANRANPLGFYQTGANMLSTVLKSPVAVQRSVDIMRAFTAMEVTAASAEFKAARVELRKARQAARQCQLEWQANRTTGKVMRRELTDTIKMFIGYAKGQGSRSAERYYMGITVMINDAVLGKQAARDPNFRDSLGAFELMMLGVVEQKAAQYLQEAMQLVLQYKACFQETKGKVIKLVGVMRDAGVLPQLFGSVSTPAGILPQQ